METSKKNNILIDWFFWQFFETPRFLFKVWNNYFMFAANFFSVLLLLKTFFSPWRRYIWQYPKEFSFGEFFYTFLSNIVSRVMGALMRIVLIIVGVCLQIFVVIVGAIVLIIWILIPFIIIAGFLFVFIF